MILQTQRILLRPFRDSDAPDLYAYASDPRVGPAAGWKPHESEAESLTIIRTVFANPYQFALEDRATGRVIGSAGFVGRKHGDISGPSDELGYALSPDYWGRGIMPEVVEELLRYGFEELGMAAIWCGHYEDNHRSRRVIEKCGFVYVFSAKLSDELYEECPTRLYVCLRQDWEKRRRICHG